MLCIDTTRTCVPSSKMVPSLHELDMRMEILVSQIIFKKNTCNQYVATKPKSHNNDHAGILHSTARASYIKKAMGNYIIN